MHKEKKEIFFSQAVNKFEKRPWSVTETKLSYRNQLQLTTASTLTLICLCCLFPVLSGLITHILSLQRLHVGEISMDSFQAIQARKSHAAKSLSTCRTNVHKETPTQNYLFFHVNSPPPSPQGKEWRPLHSPYPCRQWT